MVLEQAEDFEQDNYYDDEYQQADEALGHDVSTFRLSRCETTILKTSVKSKWLRAALGPDFVGVPAFFISDPYQTY